MNFPVYYHNSWNHHDIHTLNDLSGILISTLSKDFTSLIISQSIIKNRTGDENICHDDYLFTILTSAGKKEHVDFYNLVNLYKFVSFKNE